MSRILTILLVMVLPSIISIVVLIPLCSIMTGEYCCKDKKCCDNMEEEDDHHAIEEGENDDMQEEDYYHDIKNNEDDNDIRKKDGHHEMEDENIDDQKLQFDKNSSEKYNLLKDYSLGRSRLPSISRSLVASSGCLQSYNGIQLIWALIVYL